jgi:hypothetical protein
MLNTDHMGLLRKFFRLLANYFSFVGGLLFIFTLGVIYAFVKPQGYLINGIFLLLGIGWVGFLIKYFWDLVEKNESSRKLDDDTTDINITNSSELTPSDTNPPTENV